MNTNTTTYTVLDINYTDLHNQRNWAWDLDFVKENSRSIYGKSTMYGWVYRVEKTTGKVYCDSKYIGTLTNYKVW